MTPKEKANELLGLFGWSNPDIQFNKEQLTFLKVKAKASAIICVEQIIPCTWKQSTYKKEGKIWVDEITTTEYWEEVLTILKAQ